MHTQAHGGSLQACHSLMPTPSFIPQMAPGMQKSVCGGEGVNGQLGNGGLPSLEGNGDRGVTAAHRPQGWGRVAAPC